MDRDTLLKQLTIDEGLRLKPYHDTMGKLTIGIGRNLDDDGISTPEAMFLCENDIDVIETQMENTFTWWAALSDDRQQVIANMVFNMGLDGFKKFTHLIAALGTGDYQAAAAEMRKSEWAREVGPRATRLSTRMEGSLAA